MEFITILDTVIPLGWRIIKAFKEMGAEAKDLRKSIKGTVKNAEVLSKILEEHQGDFHRHQQKNLENQLKACQRTLGKAKKIAGEVKRNPGTSFLKKLLSSDRVQVLHKDLNAARDDLSLAIALLNTEVGLETQRNTQGRQVTNNYYLCNMIETPGTKVQTPAVPDGGPILKRRMVSKQQWHTLLGWGNGEGRGLLHLAAECLAPDVAEFLAKERVDSRVLGANRKDNKGHTPLDLLAVEFEKENKRIRKAAENGRNQSGSVQRRNKQGKQATGEVGEKQKPKRPKTNPEGKKRMPQERIAVYTRVAKALLKAGANPLTTKDKERVGHLLEALKLAKPPSKKEGAKARAGDDERAKGVVKNGGRPKDHGRTNDKGGSKEKTGKAKEEGGGRVMKTLLLLCWI